jgi:hypothetical protein
MRIVIAVALIAIVLFLNYYYVHPNMFLAPEKRCERVDDCAFAPTKCCPGCDGYISVNKIYVTNISKQFEDCSKDCSHVACYSPMGFIVVPKAVCQKGECTTINEISCRAVCTYYFAMDRDVLSQEYLDKATAFLNLTKDSLVTSCGCNENQSV